MVFVDSPEGLLLGDAQKMLLNEVGQLAGKQNLKEAFAAWLLSESNLPFDISETACNVSKYTGGERRYSEVALIGFGAASSLLPQTEQQVLREWLHWLIGREPLLYGRLQPFCTDAIALLGIAIGAKALGDEDTIIRLREWFNKFITQSFKSRLEDWQQCLLIAVCQIIGLDAWRTVPTAQELADVRTALRSKGVLHYEAPTEEADQIATLSLMKLDLGNSIPDCRAVLRLAAFEFIKHLSYG